jgi:hypothetical protein
MRRLGHNGLINIMPALAGTAVFANDDDQSTPGD